jgi:manganese transport protein
MLHTGLARELGALLYWTMLAACTVGPGTVVTCARAGAEYGYTFTWALIFASILAFTLQEGTARLTIVSGKSLGQCLKIKYGSPALHLEDNSIIS